MLWQKQVPLENATENDGVIYNEKHHYDRNDGDCKMVFDEFEFCNKCKFWNGFL